MKKRGKHEKALDVDEDFNKSYIRMYFLKE